MCEPIPAQCAVSSAPEWMRQVGIEMQSFKSRARHDARACKRIDDMSMVDGLHPPQPPSFRVDDDSGSSGAGSTLPIARFRSGTLGIRALHQQFLRLGLPVLLEGVLAENVTWWHTRREKLEHCCKQHADDTRLGVQMCADACRKYAGLRARPPALRRLFENLPRPLPRVEQVFSRSLFPVLWWSAPGDDFGKATHFDEACGPTCSIQFLGAKRWTAWAPFDLHAAGVRAHTRFETIVNAGDVLILPPSWYHATKVLQEGGPHSVTSIYELHHLGVYGSVHGSFRGSPYGFEVCAEGDGNGEESDCPGWRQSSARWDEAMESFDEAAEEARRDEL